MTIKFMLNSPSDAISPYASEEHFTESPFDGTNNFISTRLRSREYSGAVAADVSSSVAGVTDCQYLGSMERIAREVYQIQIFDNSYEVAFIFDTHTSQDIQLHVEITSPNLPASDFETRYDKPLEALKLALKNRLIRDWKGCTWLIDDQSEMLCADLYPRFFRIENQCRAFSNEVLIHHLGQNWLDHPGLEKFKNSVCSMESAFKQTVPAFANINSSLLSMTLETLAEVINKAAVYESTTSLTTPDIEKLYEHLHNHNVQAAWELIEKKRVTKISLWDDIFSRYFDSPPQFQRQLTQFIKGRNHIAHNKLLTFAAFQQMHKELSEFENTLEYAAERFEAVNLSVEQLDTLMIERGRRDNDLQYWKERLYAETGVVIRDEWQIFKLFRDTVSDICDDLSDKYHYDPCFDVNVSEIVSSVDITQVCIITSSASSDKLRIYVSMTLDGEMDAASFLEIEAKHKDEIVASAECIYHNGEGYEKDDGSCDIKSGSDYDDHEIRDFMDIVTAYIEEELNPNIKRLSDLEYECERYGGYYPVADFACAECGKNGVSVRDDFLPIGKCCYCGYENEVYVCERCGTVYDDTGGNKHLCNGCLPQDE